mgnify:CR=1 FL=1
MLHSQSENSSNNYKDIVSNLSNELDLGLVFYIVKKSLWIVLSLFIICFSSAFFYLRYSQTIYQASSVIQINDGQQASQILQINKVEVSSNKIAEAIEQMRSRIFLKKVVENSEFQISYFNEGTFKNNELYKSSPYFVKFYLKDNTIYGSKIYIKFNSLTNGKITFFANGKNNSIPFNTNTVLNSPYFDLSITLNNDMLSAVGDFFFAMSSTSGLWSLDEIKQWQLRAGFKHYSKNRFLTIPGYVAVTGQKL